MLRKSALAIIYLYQCTLGTVLPSSCRFYPSCSNYAAEAFQTLPFLKSLAIVLWRIVRCNPLCRGGYDPVPRKKAWAKVIESM